jgi:hypothetical protein
MEQEIPGFILDLIHGFRFVMPLLIVAGLWFAVRRSGLPAPKHMRVWSAMAVLFLGWFALAWLLGRADLFTRAANEMPLIQFAIFPPILIGLALMLGTATGRTVAAAVPQSWLVGVQVYRSLGAMFLVLWARGTMPSEFAIPAGVGDIIVGLTAPIVAWLNARNSPHAYSATLGWNVFGILDLVVAVGTGFLTSPSTMQMLAFDRPNLLITAYPTVLVPLFLVPLSIILHGLSLWKLSHERHATTAREAHA